MNSSLDLTNKPKSSLPVIAAFDFDGTLTNRDSFLPFLRKLIGKKKFILGMIWISPFILAYFLKVIPNWLAKEQLLSHFLGGKDLSFVARIAEQFALEDIPKLLNPRAIEQLHFHQMQGHKIILISASLEIYLLPFSEVMGIDYVIATQLETKSNVLTGKISGKNCYGPEKVNRLEKVLGNLKDYCIYAYGDSRGDQELLSVSTFPHFRSFKRNPRARRKTCLRSKEYL